MSDKSALVTTPHLIITCSLLALAILAYAVYSFFCTGASYSLKLILITNSSYLHHKSSFSTICGDEFYKPSNDSYNILQRVTSSQRLAESSVLDTHSSEVSSLTCLLLSPLMLLEENLDWHVEIIAFLFIEDIYFEQILSNGKLAHMYLFMNTVTHIERRKNPVSIFK